MTTDKPSRNRRPVVGVVSDSRMIEAHRNYLAGEKYVAALAAGAGLMPVILPPLEVDESGPGGNALYDAEEMLGRIDALFVPGSESNMEPWRYGEEADPDDKGWRDPQRDRTSLALIPAAIARGMPLFCVCRGFQELNVALGGTLHQQVHKVPDLSDHRAADALARDRKYAHAHQVSFAEGGILRALAGAAEAPVNSLHEQGIARLADGLAVEATAPDGLVEAVRVRDATGFALGVQWHPEWRFWEDPLSAALFSAFGDAVRARVARRQGRG